MSSLLSKAIIFPIKRSFTTSARCSFKITDFGNFCPSNMPENIEELSNAQRTVANLDRSREYSGQQTFARMFSPQFMADQYQQSHNANKDSMELTHGYDMDGHAQLASVLQTNLPEPFNAMNVDMLKEGIPEGLSDVVRERGQRWVMEDRLVNSADLNY